MLSYRYLLLLGLGFICTLTSYIISPANNPVVAAFYALPCILYCVGAWKISTNKNFWLDGAQKLVSEETKQDKPSEEEMVTYRRN